MGWDIFDCVIPTRNARHGLAYTFKSEVKINQEKYLADAKPIEVGCGCFACQNYSRAYIRHLFNTSEVLGLRLAAYHNVHYYVDLMRRIREAIDADRYPEFEQEFLAGYGSALLKI